MRVSHRVAGPVVQFRRQFGEIRDGHSAVRMSLRKDDYLRKEETAFNEMAASVEAMMAAKDTEIAKLETDLATASEFHLSGGVSFSKFDVKTTNGITSMHMQVGHIGSAND